MPVDDTPGTPLSPLEQAVPELAQQVRAKGHRRVDRERERESESGSGVNQMRWILGTLSVDDARGKSYT